MSAVSPERTGLVRSGFAVALLVLLGSALAPRLLAQPTDGYDPSWYDPTTPWVKIEVTEDGIYEVSGSDLAAAGVPLGAIDPATLKLYERGVEVPIAFLGDPAVFDPADRIQFVGRRNTGEDEAWAYYVTEESERLTPGEPLQSSTYNSLYTHTTIYWLTWNGEPGLRYDDRPLTAEPGAEDVDYVPQTFHREPDFSYYDGDSADSKNPYYTHGEGRYWWTFNQNSIRRDSVILGPRVPDIQRVPWHTALLEVRVAAGSAARHVVRVKGRRWSGYDVVAEEDWTGYGFRTLSVSIPQHELYYYPEGHQVYAEVVIDNRYHDGQTPNRVMIDWIRVTVRRYLRPLDGQDMFPARGGGNYRYLLTHYTPNTPLVILDPVTGRRFTGTTDTDGALSFGDRGNATGRFWTAEPSAIRSPAGIRMDDVVDWRDGSADYVIVTPPGLRASAQAYADLHAARSGYQTAVVELQDIFDQFDYGRPTPVALRRFFQQSRAWSTAPRYALLWGDARYPHPDTTLAPWEVPSYGVASSDSWYVQGVEGQYDRHEHMAIGRIPLRNEADAALYIQKVTRYLDAPFSDWQQRMYYLTGGTESEQNTFQNHTRSWAAIAGSPPAGQDTVFFFKTSNTILDTSLRDSVRVAIRRGSSFLSYFGHSSAQTWEIVTDPAAEFDNADRLPFVLSFGCRTGAFGGGLGRDADTRTLAESLLLEGESGAIGHWGSSELGTVSASAALSVDLHRTLFQDTLRVVGDAIRQAKNRFIGRTDSYWYVRHSTQYNLIGDPGLRFNAPDKPDLHVTEANLRVEPLIPLVADSTLTLTVDLRNRGYYPADSVTVALTHTLPDGTVRPYEVRVPPFAIADTLTFQVRMENQPGPHRFAVAADPGNAYEEMVETNNLAERTQIVFSNGLTVVAPEPYGITGRTPRLRVSIANLAGTNGLPVRFELDTVPTFDSPDLRTFNATLNDAHADWNVSEPLDDETVYYWRARIDDNDPEPNWADGRFTVSAAHAGAFTWTQRDALWLDNTGTQRLEWTEEGGWAFVPYHVSVFATSDRTGQSPLNGLIQVNNESYMLLDPGIGYLVLDGDRGTVKQYRAFVPYPNIWGYHVPGQIQALVDSLANVEEGDYVFIRNWLVGRTQNGVPLQNEVRQAFAALGSTAVDTLTYDDPWLLMARKGFPDETEEIVDPTGGPGTIEWTHKLTFSFPEGETTSPRIGPSQEWGELVADIDLPTASAAAWVDVLAATGSEVLMDSLDLRTPLDLSGIDAQEHPYLRLRVTLADPSQQSTPQLEAWRIRYAPVPELVVDGAASTFPEPGLQEGEATSARIVIRNLSDFAADTARVVVQLTNAENETETLLTETFGKVGPDEAITVDADIETRGYVGNNVLSGMAEQPGRTERVIYNNAFVGTFAVEPDRVRPVLELLVDGLRLENDPSPVVDLQNPELPFVSARPVIEVTVTDENPYLPLDDPSAFQITLDQRVLHPDEFTFTPATPERNEAHIRFEPDLAGRDTVHTLTVRAFDATGNAALVDPTAEDSTRYQVHFRVQNALEVESLYPYPNPMSRRTRLMFRMRGSDATLVDDFRIRIYTVSGRLVRELDLLRDPTLLEAGGLRIGWNSVPWDGTDEDGDPVASGVYLYKVFLRNTEGEDLAVNNPESLDRIAVIR